jgi:hypothetical protein
MCHKPIEAPTIKLKTTVRIVPIGKDNRDTHDKKLALDQANLFFKSVL